MFASLSADLHGMQKLEEKFNDNEAHKVQLHTKLKVCSHGILTPRVVGSLDQLKLFKLNPLNVQEKAETEIRRLRQSFCFKARPLPDFYKERKELKDESDKVCILILNFPI